MNYGLIVFYVLIIIDLTHDCIKHGELRIEETNIWITMISKTISLMLLWWVAGGFI